MGTFDEWLKRPDKPDPRKMSMDAIKRIDRYDRQDMAAIAKEMKEFRVKRDKLCEIAENTGGHLTSDTFFSFYKVEPDLEDAAKMRPSFLINRAVASELQNTTEWERLRSWTEADIVSSAMAFISMEDDLEALYDKCKTHQQQAEELEQGQIDLLNLENEQRSIDDLIAAWQEGDEQSLDDLEDKQRQLGEQIDQLGQAIAQQGKHLEEMVSATVGSELGNIKEAMKGAADDAESLAVAAASFGQDPGQLQRMSAQQRVQLAERLNGNDRFKKLAELIGPMQRIAQTEQTRKIIHANEEVYDIGMGNDLSRVLPGELLGVRHPILKRDFQRKFIEGKLLQYEMRGEEKVGKGGIIFCMDNSGSMMGDREVWAKATGLATMSIAKEQKRSFIGLHFGSARELMKFDFSKPELMTFDKVIDYAEFFFGGGTNFVRPLTESLKILQAEEKEKGFVEGDIVFVTDGQCSVPDAWLKDFKAEQERLAFKCWGILIGPPSQRRQEPLWSICDHNVVTISDMLSADPVRDMFRDL